MATTHSTQLKHIIRFFFCLKKKNYGGSQCFCFAKVFVSVLAKKKSETNSIQNELQTKQNKKEIQNKTNRF